jgi:hypothetical protein
MGCNIEKSIVDGMVKKGLIEFNSSRNLYEISSTPTDFIQEADRIQRELETIYGIPTEPVIFLKGGQTRAVVNRSAARDRLISSSVVRLNGPAIRKFQELEDLTEEDIKQATTSEISEVVDRLTVSQESMITQLGLKLEMMDDLKDRDGNPLRGAAAADFFKTAILATYGKEEEITEEIAHFYVEALKITQDPLYQSIRSRIFKTPEYAEVLAEYTGLETYTEESLIDEAIAKVMLNRAAKKGIVDRESRWWKRAWQKLKNMFGLEDPYVKAAFKLFNDDLTEYKEVIKNSTNPTIARSLGNQQSAESIENEIVETHNKLSISEKITRDALEGKLKNLEFFEDDDGFFARYQIEENGVLQTITNRVTDASTVKFMTSFGGLRAAKVRQSLPKPEASRNAGTNLHSAGQYLIESQTKKMKGASLVELKDRETLTEVEAKAISGLQPQMFETFRTQTGKILKDVKAIQDTIDKDKDFKVFTEVAIYNPETDTAGTIDMLFLFSDGSVAVYDFKFISPKYKLTSGYGAQKHIIVDPFRGGKLESFNMQLSTYGQTLRTIYGITNIRRSRIIPGHIDFEWENDTPKKINTFQMGGENNRFLKEISVAAELTDDDIINSKLKEIYKKLADLNKKKSTASIRRQKDIYYSAIQSLTVDSNFAQLIREISDTVGNLKNVDIKDEEDEDYITFEELYHSLEILSMFSNVREIVELKKQGLKEGSKEKEQFERQIDKLSNIVVSSITTIEEELKKRNKALSRLDTTVLSPKVGYTGKFTVMDQIDNPIFKETKRRINNIHAIVTRRNEELRLKWEALNEELEEWTPNNMSLADTYEMFIKDTGEELKLIPMFKKEFWEEVEKTVNSDDPSIDQGVLVKWMKDNFQIKEGAKESYDAFLKRRITWLKQEYPAQDQAYSQALKSFKDTYNVFGGNSSAWISPKYWMYLEVKPEVAKTVWSNEYAELNKVGNEPLLKYYKAWKEQLREFNEELRGSHLNYDFIPSVRKGIVEGYMSGNFGGSDSFMDWLTKGLKVKLDEDDTSGGINVNSIPLPFLTPLRNLKGEVTSKLVSRDLSRAMYLAGASIYNFIEKDKVEAELLWLKHQLTTEKLAGKQLAQKKVFKGKLSYGEIIKDSSGQFVEEKMSEDTVQLYNQLFNYYMYGHSYSSDDTFFDMPIIGEVSAQKLVSKMNSVFSFMKISLPVRLAISTKIAGSIFINVEGAGGVHYSNSDVTKAMKMYASSQGRPVYQAVTDYFNLHTEGHQYHRSRKMHSSMAARNLDTSVWYEFLGMTDRSIDRTIGVAMMHTHGLSKDGTVKRLSQLPEGTEPLIKLLKENVVVDSKKRARVKLGTMSDEAFAEFRQKVKRVASGVKGEQGEDNIVAAHTELAFRLFGTFKWWMPGFLHKRFKGRYFDYIEDMPVEGRYWGLQRGMANREEFDSTQTIFTRIMSTLYTTQNLLSHLTLLKSYNISAKRKAALEAKGKWGPAKQARYDAQRASIKLELEHLKQNSNDPDFIGMDLESYIEMREASVKSGLREVQATIALILMSMVMGARGLGDDEDKTLASSNHGTRMLSEILAKVQLEVTFALNPMELVKLNQSGTIPALGIVEDGIRLFAAAGKDLFSDSTDARSKSFSREFFETLTPGHNQFYTFLTGDK